MTRRTILWAVAALLGIVATAAVAWSTSQLAAQRIGLASEPLSVASGLAPPGLSAQAPRPAARHHGKPPRQPLHAVSAASSAAGQRQPISSPVYVAPSAGSQSSTAAVASPAPVLAAPPAATPTGSQSSPPVTQAPTMAPASRGHDDSSGSSDGSGRSVSGSRGRDD